MPRIRWELLWNDPEGYNYKALNTTTFYYPRWKGTITVEEGFKSDGATGARDIKADAWGVHDKVCVTGKWDDGRKICNATASMILSIQLYRDGYKYRSVYWFFATLFGGGGEAKKNGMFSLKEGKND